MMAEEIVKCGECGQSGKLYAELVGGTIQDPVLKYFVMHPRVSKSNPRPTRRVKFHELIGYKPATVMDKLEQIEV